MPLNTNRGWIKWITNIYLYGCINAIVPVYKFIVSMNNQVIIILIALICVFGCNHSTQVNSDKNVPEKAKQQITGSTQQRCFNELKRKDSLLFELGFNQCDTNQVKTAISDDFEFYHDQSGITGSKESFVRSIADLCNATYKPSRELVEHSLEVHLLKKNGEIYGAIQKGKHKFYEERPDKTKYLTSTANFIHLWILEGDDWKLKRVFSYNHKEPEQN